MEIFFHNSRSIKINKIPQAHKVFLIQLSTEAATCIVTVPSYFVKATEDVGNARRQCQRLFGTDGPRNLTKRPMQLLWVSMRFIGEDIVEDIRELSRVPATNLLPMPEVYVGE